MGEEEEDIRAALIKRYNDLMSGGPDYTEPGGFSEHPEYLRELTKPSDFLPEPIKRMFWGYDTKDIMLGCLSAPDRISVKNRGGLIVDWAILDIPDYRYTSEIALNFVNFKHNILNQTFRGGDGFERVMQTQQTRLSINETKNGNGPVGMSPRSGILGRAARFLKGGQ